MSAANIDLIGQKIRTMRSFYLSALEAKKKGNTEAFEEANKAFHALKNEVQQMLSLLGSDLVKKNNPPQKGMF